MGRLDGLAGVFIDQQGRVVVVDSLNRRLVRVVGEGEEGWWWEEGVDTQSCGLGYPKVLEVVDRVGDGEVGGGKRAVVAFHDGVGGGKPGHNHIAVIAGV